jgi:hypothetical protein
MEALEQLISEMPSREFEPEVPASATEEFWEEGFTRIDRITTDEEIEWLRRLYDVMMRGEVSDTALVRDVMVRLDEQRDDRERVSQIIKPELTVPALLDTLFWRNSRKVAAAILDAEPDSLEGWGHMVRKAPHDDEVLAWHQDEGFWDPHFDYRALGVWLALDPATEKSGCMSFLPGSHKNGVHHHELGAGDPAVTYLEIPDVDEGEARLQPVPVGAASIHHCRTMHKSGPNVSDHVRRAYINEWQAPPVARAHPHDRPWWFAREEARRDMTAKSA